MKLHNGNRAVVFVVLAILTLGIVGCSKKESTQVSNTSAETVGQEVVTWIGNQDDFVMLQPFLEQFMIDNPDIKVEFEGVPFNEIDKKANLAHTSGNGYDIISVNHTSTPQFVGGQVLDDLTSYLEGSSINLEKSFNKSNYDIANIGGKQYAIPYGPDVRVLAYNKDLLAAIGADVPTAPAEILALGPAIKEQGAYLYGMDRKNRWDPIYVTGCFMLSMGANVYTKSGDNFQATCTTPEMFEYVELMEEMYPYMPQDISVNEDQLRELFCQNKLAFYIYGPWENHMRIPESGVNYGLTLIPTTSRTSSAMGGWLIGMGNNGKDKDAAWKLIEYIYRSENISAICLGLPPTKEAFEYPPFNDKEVYGIFEEQMATGQIPVAPMVNTNRIAELYFDYFSRAVTGAMPIRDAMNKVQSEIEKLLETN